MRCPFAVVVILALGTFSQGALSSTRYIVRFSSPQSVSETKPP